MSDETNIIPYDREYWESSFDIRKCRISAESGYAPAQDELGNCYKRGVGVHKD